MLAVNANGNEQRASLLSLLGTSVDGTEVM
jgi:hypothetical protein